MSKFLNKLSVFLQLLFLWRLPVCPFGYWWQILQVLLLRSAEAIDVIYKKFILL